jgi:hypothetical protein
LHHIDELFEEQEQGRHGTDPGADEDAVESVRLQLRRHDSLRGLAAIDEQPTMNTA